MHEVKAKVEYADKNLKTIIEERRQTNDSYSLSEIWNLVTRICEIAQYLYSAKRSMPEHTSSYLIIS